MIINMTGGGGGAALNFKVVPGLTQPGTASENTIWVKTEKIGAWYFSATQPEGLQEWDVWFPTGTESVFEFDALKKNGLQVYLISAKQYVSGTCKNKEAYIFYEGAWVQFSFERFYLVKGGVIENDVSFQSKQKGTITQKAGRTLFATAGNNNDIFYSRIKKNCYTIMRFQTGSFENEWSYVNVNTKEMPTVRVTSAEPVLPATSSNVMGNVIASALVCSLDKVSQASNARTGDFDLTIDISAAPEWIYPLVYIGGSNALSEAKGRVSVINWWFE